MHIQSNSIKEANMPFVDLAQITAEQKTAYSYGYEWLYRMCHDERSVSSEKTIASTIWLIGRSYAASSERIKRIKNSSENSVSTKADFANAEAFFLELSKNACLNALVSGKNFDNYSYDVDRLENDLTLLQNSAENVYSLNEALKKSGNLKDNPISFSSKYLHFFYPNSVFIIDQFSRNGSRWLFHKKIRKRKTIRISDSECITLDECRKNMAKDKYDHMKAEMEAKGQHFSNNKTMMEYIDHICCCYALAFSLKHNGFDGISIFDRNKSMPRLVDTLLLKVGSEE